MLGIADAVRETSAAAVAALHEAGVQVVMLTGDNQATARRIADELGIDTVIAEVLPQDKSSQVTALQQAGHRVAMVGDGVQRRPRPGGRGPGHRDRHRHRRRDRDRRRGPHALGPAGRAAPRWRSAEAPCARCARTSAGPCGYNAVALPIAAGVFEPAFGLVLRPEIAALSMSGSSFLVAVNALLLKRLRLPAAPPSSRTATAGSRTAATRGRALDVTPTPPAAAQPRLPTPAGPAPHGCPGPTLHSHACDSGTMTASTRTGRRLGWSPAGCLVAVVTLALAVIGMHSMGAGHSDLMVDGTHGMTQHGRRGHALLAPWHLHGAAGSAGDPGSGLDLITAVAPPHAHARSRPGRGCSGSACAGTAAASPRATAPVMT